MPPSDTTLPAPTPTPGSCGCTARTPRATPAPGPGWLDHARRGLRSLVQDPALRLLGLLLVLLAVLSPAQVWPTLLFGLQALWNLAPWLLLSAALAAYAQASHADHAIGRAFTGAPRRAVVLAALVGVLSPFCSCGVIALVAGLLGAGVPLAPIMAFWISSPLMDPAMFVLTAATLGLPFALAKTLAALVMGLLAGWVTLRWGRGGIWAAPLRGAPTPAPVDAATPAPPLQWRVWAQAERRRDWAQRLAHNSWSVGRWMLLAFALESLLITYVPASSVARWLGDSSASVGLAVLVGIPAYLNGMAALPLVAGLVELGMHPAVGMGFLLGGGVTSLAAMSAVWALVRPRVFALYLALAVGGALLASYAYALVLRAWGTF